MMSDEEWVKAAMTDDSMVVDLLVRLNHAIPASKLKVKTLDWTVRHRRSKPTMVLHLKNSIPNRNSPSTPLSWSGTTSHSGGGERASVDGFEESSRSPPKSSVTTRSKVKRTSGKTILNRLKKKKTLAELKEEEILLLKERRHLKGDLAALRTTVDNQRATNDSLKRLKLELQPEASAERPKPDLTKEATSDQIPQEKAAASDPDHPILPASSITTEGDVALPSFLLQQISKVQKGVVLEEEDTKFVLPDLNLPLI